MMQPILVNLLKRNVILILLFAYYNPVFAQKLPNKQDVNLLTPIDIKIDGKSTEWGNQFQAYNNSTEVFYSVANNDDVLYLTVQARKPLIIKKIINQSITFSLKRDNNNVSITYPIMHGKGAGIIAGLTKVISFLGDSAVFKKSNDSVVNEMNMQLLSNSKQIRVTGMTGVTDSLISIYNEYEIKAMGLFDNRKTYTIELSIPIKLLGLSIDKANKFTYNIKLNGVSLYGTNVRQSEDGKHTLIGDLGDSHPAIAIKSTPDMLTLNYDTDFSGEYILAKKP